VRLSAVRVFFVGGLLSYRALFHFLQPAIYVPSLLVAPVFQVLLFVYIGRSAGTGQGDEFYVIGNALQYASVPAVFAMTHVIAGERYQQTLGMILVSPAPRLAIFVGRALPVIVNAWFVSAFTLGVSVLLLGISIPASALVPLAVATAAAAYSCTGLGLVTAAIGLVVRETAVLANIVFGLLLILTGANVPLERLPGILPTISEALPFTHAIAAGRRVADGEPLSAVAGLVGTEVAIGTIYLVAGFALLRALEHLSRRHATLERA
jgi:ABC-2 type transport system permease protein